MRQSLIAFAFATSFMLGSVSANAEPIMSPDEAKTPDMTPALNLGKMNYTAKCAECHGENGVGTDKGPPFLHRVYNPGHHTDGAFYAAALEGARAHHWKFGNMKPVEGITEAQIEKIIAYVRALQKANGLF